MSERRGRRRWLLVSGIVVLVGFIALAVGLWFAADARYDDNVAAFARAPVGCETTLDFDRSGEFVLYIETTGQVDGLDGDCDVTQRYDRAANGLPQPELTLRDPDGDELVLDSTGGVDYDTGEFVGTAYRLVDIAEQGDHVLVVGSVDGEAFAMSIGGDPRDGVALLRSGALAAMIVGLIGGGILLVLASRRPTPAESVSTPWQPSAFDGQGWPTSPPGFPAPPPTTGALGPAGPPLLDPPRTSTITPPSRPVPPASPASPWSPPSVD